MMRYRMFSIFLFSLLLFSCGENKKGKSPEIKNASANKKEEAAIPFAPEYKILKSRKSLQLKNDLAKQLIKNYALANVHFDQDSLIDFTLDLTAQQLQFTFEKCSSEPNAVFKNKKANCIGYAAVFNSMFNYAIHCYKQQKNYTCDHYVGKIYISGQNTHALFNNPFFKDHDFNVITDLQSGKRIAIDASLYDYMMIRRVRLK